MWTFWVFSTRIIACLLGDEPPTRGKVGDLNCYPLYLTFSQPSDSLPFAPLADEVIYGRRLKRSRVDVMDISTSFILNGMSESLRNEWWALRMCREKLSAILRRCCGGILLLLFGLKLTAISLKRGRNFLQVLFRSRGGSSSWKYFGEFLCTDIEESVFLHKRGFLAAAVTSFTSSSSKQHIKWRTKEWLFICLIMFMLLSQP